MTVQNSDNKIIQKRPSNSTPESLGDVKAIGTDFCFIRYNPTATDEYIINLLDCLNRDPNSDMKAPVTPYGPLRFIVLLRQDPGGLMIWKYLTSPNRIHFSIESVFKKVRKTKI